MAKSKTREKIYFSFLSLAVILVTAELYNSRLVVLRNRSLSNDDHEAQACHDRFKRRHWALVLIFSLNTVRGTSSNLVTFALRCSTYFWNIR